MLSLTNLAIFDENRELRVVFLLFRTSFVKVKSKESKYFEKETNICEPHSAWITPTDLEGFWADMHRILLNWFMFFIRSYIGESIELSRFEKHILKTYRTRTPRFSTNTVMVK